MTQKELLQTIHKAAKEKATKLSLYRKGIKELPPEIGLLTHLKELDLRLNQLSVLPAEIGQLQQLQRLDLRSNQLSVLPAEIGQLQQLQRLDLRSNQLSVLPVEIGQLQQLQKLYLRLNQLSVLPAEIVQLQQLQKLYLSSNQLSVLPAEIGQLQQLQILDLSSNQLSVLPAEIVQLQQLQKLYLRLNQLSVLPAEIVQLQNLSELYLSSNQLSVLPAEIGQLQQLQRLDLRSNQLSVLPAEIGQLQQLQRLDLRSNQLSVLPAEIVQLQQLQRLDLSSNQLSVLPAEIGQLQQLQRLDLRSNQLSVLPAEIGQLQQLQRLDLRSNQLSSLPSEIGQLQNLWELDLSENPKMVSPPPLLIKKGTKAILKYLRQDQVRMWQSKMILVGQGGVGKSCLLDALRGEDFEEGKDTTHGIQIEDLSYPCPHSLEDTMHLHVWDFGGQEIYHATHQFYLSNHALFVLVWSARQGFEAGKLYQWLETVKALAPNSPILVVATSTKERGADLPKDELHRNYPNIVGFFEVDNSNKKGIDLLAQQIQATAAKLPYMGADRPKSWITATEALEALNQRYISKSQLFDIFQEQGVFESNWEALAEYLHAMGEILYFSEDERLKDTIIVKPDWVSQHIALILDSEELSQQAGFLSRQLMRKLWHDLTPTMRDKFLLLMQKFDLSHPVHHEEDVCLVVEKLKLEEDLRYKDRWATLKDSPSITFKYQLDTVLAGIPTWFIARSHRFSTYIHWLNGALLEYKGHLGLVLAKPHEREVWLSVRGAAPHYFFDLLRDTLEFTFERFEGLKWTPFVPCLGHEGEECTHHFKFEHLEKRLKRTPPKTEIECPEGEEDISVMKMLFGISDTTRKEVFTTIDVNQQKSEDLQKKILAAVEKGNQKNDQISQQVTAQTRLMLHKMEEEAAAKQAENEELRLLLQWSFLKLYHHVQQLGEVRCPNVFSLIPKQKDWWQSGTKIHFDLHLYCQNPACMHIVETYEIAVHRKWVKQVLPYYNKMVKFLKIITPLVVPAGFLTMAEGNFEDLKNFAEAGQEYSEQLETKDLKRHRMERFEGGRHRAEGHELRLIRKVLDEYDPNQVWGGLRKFTTPEGQALWLCQEHIEEYREGRKVIER